MQDLRRHQKECLVAIDKHFEAENSRALIKMFCGAGKSLIIYNTLLKHGGNLSVVVVPSINLITQFNTDYLIKFAEHSKHDYTTLTVCSKDEIGTKGVEFTTDPDEILEFLESEDDEHKIVLITYQSLETLFTIIEENEMTIDLICFDEAHRVTAEGTQELLFGSATDEYSDERYGFIDSNIERSLFFTATPINKNGICMFNLDNHITIGDTDYEIQDTLDVNECSSEEPHCGDMICEYMHLDGVNDNVLNDFDIRVDLSTQEGEISIFEAIARTILETGNSRVLTFHSRSEVASEKGSSVIAFYSEENKKLFKKAFDKVLQAEYPQKKDYYKKITLTGITGSTKNRTKILDVFDKTPDDEIYLLGSCETIGEGVDTKNANMCVFVDPKQSYVKIIQNIGRICRKQVIKRNGTILIPARVNVEKYKGCGGDPMARDKVIREEMSKSGDFNGILNCLSALRQEDPYMFELCLKYPDVYTKKELKDNFRKNGMVLDEKEYSGEELFSDLGVEYNPKVSEKANFNMLSRKLGTNIQVSNQKILEEDLYIDKGCERITHFVKTADDKYMKVNRDKTCKEKREKRVERPHRNTKPFVHSNSEIQVLWGFTSDIDVGKSVFGGYIEADVVVDNEEKWHKKLEGIKNYMDVNGKRPSKEDKDKTIRCLGVWIGDQLTNYKRSKYIMKNPEFRKAWEQFKSNLKYSKYFLSNEDDWYENLKASKNHMDVHGKRPSEHDKDKQIKFLGKWISTQLTNYKHSNHIMKNPEFRKAWEDVTSDPKYSKYFTSNEEVWYGKLTDSKNHMDVHGERPSEEDKDNIIRSLGVWISTQLKNYKESRQIMKNPEFRQAWESYTSDPKYSKYFTSNEEVWYGKLTDSKNYMDVHDKRPSQHDKDKTIRCLGVWISQQLINYKESKYIMSNPEIRKVWEDFTSDPKYSKYLTGREEDWYENLKASKNHMDVHGKRPSKHDKDKQIKFLGSWISKQLINYKAPKHIMANPEFRKAWEEFTSDPKYSKYFISNEEVWYENLKASKNCMNVHNKRPSSTDTDNTIRSLGKWISHQLKNYKEKKHIMVNPEIRQAWESFTRDPKYSKYFTQDQKPTTKSTTVKPKIKTIDEPKETEVQRHQRKVSEYQELTKKMATQKSETTNQMFTTTPSLWHDYHDSRDFSFKGYDKPDEIPLNKIIKYLETKKNHKLNILDLGCGRNLIQEHFKDNKKFTVTGYE
jgi:superfamily II DNA or RNA helicase